jgi:hypothetical protein
MVHDTTIDQGEGGPATRGAGGPRAAAGSPEATATSPPDEAVRRATHPDEGNTAAAWTACSGVIIGTALGGLALVFEWIALGVVAAIVIVAGLVVGGLLARSAAREHDGDPAGPGDDAPAAAEAAVHHPAPSSEG